MMNTARLRRPRTPRHRSRGASTRRDCGYTLIEVVVSIVLIGVVILPILSAVRVGVHASSVSRSAAKAETAVVNAADRINRAPQDCDYSIYAKASVQTEGWEPEQAVVAHQWFDYVTDTWVDGGCPFQSPTIDLVQKVTVTITTPDDELSRTIQVVKSNV